MPNIGTFAAIFDDKNKILLCHRRDFDLWNLPGGKLEKNESPWQAIIRETKEETGLNVKIKKLAGIYHKPQKNEIIFQFVCEIINGKIKLNNEADKIKYFAFNDIPKNTSPKQIERIKDILNNPENITMKTQTGKSSRELFFKNKST
jgi:ADP-ribose pyrophosphatase YjhB (NUDIX family)